MRLIEQILTKSNVREALERVISNKGAPGIDGMPVEELRAYMNTNWEVIKQSILAREYRPKPVRRVEISKPNGGVRKLGIPSVVDRVIQQSIVQVLTPIFESEFQECSYGFRPQRSCEQAVLKTDRIRQCRLRMDSGHRLGEILRQRPPRQADELCWQSNPCPRHRESDTQVSEIWSNGEWDILSHRSWNAARR